MIDTIRGYLEIKPRYVNGVVSILNFNSYIENENGVSIRVKVKNIKVTVKLNKEGVPYRLFFYGSLSKYYYGNNLKHLDLESTRDAIKQLSKDLKVNLRSAVLTRVDFGCNIELQNNICNYIACIHSYPRLDYCRYRDSVSFYKKNSSKAFTFYDKIKEVKNNDKEFYNTIPYDVRGRNIMRYEIRLKKNLKFHLKRDKVKLRMLYRKDVWDILLEKLVKSYDNTIKADILDNPLHLIEERDGVKLYLAYHGLSRLGVDTILSLISSLEFDVKNSRSKRSKMKYVVKDLLRKANIDSLDKSLIGELDNKIKTLDIFNF